MTTAFQPNLFARYRHMMRGSIIHVYLNRLPMISELSPTRGCLTTPSLFFETFLKEYNSFLETLFSLATVSVQ